MKNPPSPLAPLAGSLLVLGLLAGPAAALPIQFMHSFDLEATGIEVTQSVQDLANSVTLVADKPTTVRVYATHASAKDLVFFPLAKTRLAATRLAPGPATLLGYLDQAAFVPEDPDLARVSPGNSANFVLPKSWRSGTVQFAAAVDFEGKFAEDDEANNAVVTTVTFEEVPPVRLRIYLLDYPGTDVPTPTDLALLRSWLRRAFPTAALDVEYRNASTQVALSNDSCNCLRNCADQENPGTCAGNMFGACFNDSSCGVNGPCVCAKSTCEAAGTCVNDPGVACDANTDCGCARVNGWLTLQRQMDQDDPGFDPDRRYVAITRVGAASFLRGCSPGLDEKVATGPTGDPDDFQFTSWDTDASFGDWYTAHELGHAYGLDHWTCCGATGTPYVPYGSCSLAAADSHVGYDTAGPEVLLPSESTDVMSYCEFQWTSDLTYEALLDQLVAEGGAPAPPPAPPTDKLFIQGQANLLLGTARFGAMHVLPSFAVAPTGGSVGAWEIRLLDGTGGSTSHFFEPSPIADDHNAVDDPALRFDGVESTASIAELVELPAAPVVQVQLYEEGNLRASRVVSANAPTVALTSPNGGELLDANPTLVSWSAFDADGDDLAATLEYSADAGSTWSSLASGIPDSTYALDPTLLAGGDAVKLRVTVSDGFHTASDESDAVLAVADAAPVVAVVAPAAGGTTASGEALLLEADAHDAEDGALGGTSVEWTSDRQGTLGSGESLVADNLVPGTHVLTVEATDSSGQSASATTTVVVGSATADACAATPRGDCDAAGRAAIRYREGRDPTQRRLAVLLRGGAEERTASDFGTPGAGTTPTLCLYENGALAAALPLASAAPWTDLGGRGWRLDAADGSPIRQALLRAGSASRPARTQVIVRAAGEGVPDLAPPVAVPLAAQVVNDTTATCVAATWTEPDRNEVALLRASR